MELEKIEKLKNAECPWPVDIWTMTVDEYAEVVPDENLRTAISGFLMRLGWQERQKQLEESIKEIKESNNE